MSEPSEDTRLERRVLLSETSLQSPILLLVASLESANDDEITSHDLLHAYTTLLLRIRATACSLTQAGPTTNFLRPVETNAGALARCLQRDIRRALEDPLASASQASGLPLAALTSLPSIHPFEDDLYDSRDSSAICQHAIQVAAAIFRLPALHSLFPQLMISHLLDDLLVVARCSELPSFNGENISAAASWAFSTIRVPATIVASKTTNILSWMGELADNISPKTYGAKTIHHLLSTYPSTFVPAFVRFLPDVLGRLIAPNNSVRADAALVLSGLSLGLLSTWTAVGDTLKKRVLADVRRFLLTDEPSGLSEVPVGTQLQNYVSRAVAEDMAVSNGGPRWAVIVVCSFILLSGQGVFIGRRFCQFVLKTAGQVARIKRPPAPELLACLWKCLVWAFRQFPPDDPNTSVDLPPNAYPPISIREAAFGIVRQESKGGIGACLVAALLYERSSPLRGASISTPDPDVGRAISVLKDLVSQVSDDTYRDGRAILDRMLAGVGASSGLFSVTSNTRTWCPDDIPIKSLFARQALIVDLHVYSSSLHSATQFDPSAVRPLLEPEIRQYWKELLEVWTLCTRRELQRAKCDALPDELIQTWQALLLVRMDLTQGRGHLTTTPECLDAVVSTVGDLLAWNPEPSAKPASPSVITFQCRVLSASYQLWNVMRHVFSDSWLVSVAGSLLSQTVRRTFELSQEHVKVAWSRFCAALISANSPNLLARLVAEDEEHRTVDIRRELWTLTARTWTSIAPQSSWTHWVEFLSLPIKYWYMTEEETSVWDEILDHAVNQAYNTLGSALVVFDALVAHESRGPGATNTFLRILSRLSVKGDVEGPPVFLQLICTTLGDLYTGIPENITTALQAMTHIRRIVQQCPTNSIVVVLTALADGLSAWIGDERELLLEQEHNDVVVPLYCDALNALQSIPISSDTLQALAHFLYSAFIRIPEPGLGPIAFYRFWMHIQPSLARLDGVYPEDIKTALRACHDAFGFSLPADISLETGSPSDSQVQGRSSLSVSPTKLSSPAKGSAKNRVGASSHSSTRRALPGVSSRCQEISPPATTSEASRSPTTLRSTRYLSHDTGEPDSSPTGQNAGCSDYMPSSPTDAIRARRLAVGPSSRVAHERPLTTPDRPLKRSKLTSLPMPKDRTATSLSRFRARASPTAGGSKWRFDSVEIETYSQQRRRRGMSTTHSTMPGPSKTRVEQPLSPTVPSPLTVASVTAPSSDDYDTWEVPICAGQDMDTDDVIPDSQPSHDRGDDDSLLPSFMKTSPAPTSKRHDGDPSNGTQGHPGDADAEDAHVSSSNALGKRPQHTSRMRTAPASLLRELSPVAEHRSAPLRRAHTAFAQLDELRNVYDVLQQDGSQLGVKDIVAATALTHQLGTLLSEKLSKKLGGRSGTEQRKQ